MKGKGTTAGNMVAASTDAETATTHKEDTTVSTSPAIVPDWKPFIVSWYAGSPKPSLVVMRLAREVGLPEYPSSSPRDRVRTLAVAGFDIEEIIAATPSLNPVDIVDLVDKIPPFVYSIRDQHLAGLTPIEIAAQTSISRPRIYYWLGRLGLNPHRRSRSELSARQRSQIVKAYGSGEPMRSIASRFGVSYDQVRYAVRQHGQG